MAPEPQRSTENPQLRDPYQADSPYPEPGPFLGNTHSPDAALNYGVQQNPHNPYDFRRTPGEAWTPDEDQR
jgi:hypothetical protein